MGSIRWWWYIRAHKRIKSRQFICERYLGVGAYPESHMQQILVRTPRILFQAIAEGRTFCAQSIGGTGPIRVAAEFLKTQLG